MRQYVTGFGVARRLPESRYGDSVADAKFAHRMDTNTTAASGAATRKVQSTSRGPSLTSAATRPMALNMPMKTGILKMRHRSIAFWVRHWRATPQALLSHVVDSMAAASTAI